MTPKDTLPTNALSANRASDQPDWCLSDFHYDLPENLIAQVPLAGRSDSRLMQVDGSTVKHQNVRDLPGILRPGDHLVFNDTRVVPARLYGQKASGGRLELMLERVTSTGSILAKIRASKSPKPGTTLILNSSDSSNANIDALVKARHADLFELEAVSGSNEELALFIESHGEIPLPPYIQRKPDADDARRYQTVFAEHPGAVAAPTAGLHFDEGLLEALASA
ncbi:MAG: S-adenosylmethionine:tRNA ribosyltransferase-isomerase, partial [Granulosicoccus sp.]